MTIRELLFEFTNETDLDLVEGFEGWYRDEDYDCFFTVADIYFLKLVLICYVPLQIGIGDHEDQPLIRQHFVRDQRYFERRRVQVSLVLVRLRVSGE